MIKAVIFDLDDTLCDSSGIIEDILRNIFTKYLKYFPDKDVDDLISLNIKIFDKLIYDPNIPLSAAIIRVWFEFFENLRIKPPLEIILKLIEHIRKEVPKKVKLIDGVQELIKFLKSKDIKIGVLTNGIFIDQVNKLIKLNLDSFVDYLVTADMCGCEKPNPKMFKYLLNKMDVSPNQVLMIGNDILADVKGANDLGIKTMFFKNNSPKNVDMRLVKPDYTATNHKSILKLVKRLTKS